MPVLGIVENMSYFQCPSDGIRYDIFGTGGGRREAARLQVPLLGEIPIDIPTREAGDKGRPITVADSQGTGRPVVRRHRRTPDPHAAGLNRWGWLSDRNRPALRMDLAKAPAWQRMTRESDLLPYRWISTFDFHRARNIHNQVNSSLFRQRVFLFESMMNFLLAAVN